MIHVTAHQIYVHITWCTLGRRPMVDPPTREFLEQFFRRTLIQERIQLVALAILQTHVHLLVRLPPSFDLPRLVQLLKGGSSYAASCHPGNILGLRWNKSYSVTTVSPMALPAAIDYLVQQEKRHPDQVVRHRPGLNTG